MNKVVTWPYRPGDTKDNPGTTMREKRMVKSAPVSAAFDRIARMHNLYGKGDIAAIELTCIGSYIVYGNVVSECTNCKPQKYKFRIEGKTIYYRGKQSDFTRPMKG